MRSARVFGAGTLIVAVAVVLSGCIPVALPPRASDLPDDPVPPHLVVGECPWPTGEATPAPTPPVTDDPVADAEAVALSEDRFWELIESIPDRPGPEDFEEVASRLSGCFPSDTMRFDARLKLVLYALDGPENVDWLEANDPTGLGFVSDDVFLYARCAAVLGGRDSWTAAVRDHTVDWGDDRPDIDGASESLLYVAVRAAGAQGMSSEDFSALSSLFAPLSYETGSNIELWVD